MLNSIQVVILSYFCFKSGVSLGMQLYQGVKKSGLMGFCDPCPGDSKQLKIAYSYQGHHYEVFLCHFLFLYQCSSGQRLSMTSQTLHLGFIIKYACYD
jgi:hypothetical protein